MTYLTWLCRLYMGWTFTRCHHTIVTTDTCANNLIMINQWINWRPDLGFMASLTSVRGINMRCTFTCRLNTIMTTDTRLSGNLTMIKFSIQPISGEMANIARFTGLNMGRTLARCGFAVVTTDTSTDNLVVVNNFYWHPLGGRGMTGITQIAGCNVLSTLARG